MKIITNNYKATIPEYPKQITCQTCNSVIEVIATDITTQKAKNLTGAKDGSQDYDAKGFVCPACGKVVITE